MHFKYINMYMYLSMCMYINIDFYKNVSRVNCIVKLCILLSRPF